MRSLTASLVFSISALLLAALGGGCAAPAVNLVANKTLQVARPVSPLGQALEPTVILRDGVLEITGVVRPVPRTATTRPLSNPHVELIFVAKDGAVVDGMWVIPSPLVDGTLSYSYRYLWTPPAGATLQVAYVDDFHAPVNVAYGGGSAGPGGAAMVGYGAPGGTTYSRGLQTGRAVGGLGGRPSGALGSFSPGYGGGGRGRR